MKTPQLLILRDNNSPVITKYVALKKSYGEDIGIPVIDQLVASPAELSAAITAANHDPAITGIILQLPLSDPATTDQFIAEISPAKDIDGLTPSSPFDSATALAIHQLLAGYGIDLTGKKIAIVGRGRLVGAPLAKMWQTSGHDIQIFSGTRPLPPHNDFDIIVSATGAPSSITNEMVKPSATVVDAGTASEDGRLVGDTAPELRHRPDITITPEVGGVGPMTVAMLFENLLRATAHK